MDKLLRGVGSVCVLWLNMKDESLHFSSHSCLVLSIISTLCVCVYVRVYIHTYISLKNLAMLSSSIYTSGLESVFN